MLYRITKEDIERGSTSIEQLVDNVIERNGSGIYKISLDGFYDDSDSVPIPPSLIEQFNKLGMLRPISREELKDAMDYYNRICGNTDFSVLGGDKN